MLCYIWRLNWVTSPRWLSQVSNGVSVMQMVYSVVSQTKLPCRHCSAWSSEPPIHFWGLRSPLWLCASSFFSLMPTRCFLCYHQPACLSQKGAQFEWIDKTQKRRYQAQRLKHSVTIGKRIVALVKSVVRFAACEITLICWTAQHKLMKQVFSYTFKPKTFPETFSVSLRQCNTLIDSIVKHQGPE